MKTSLLGLLLVGLCTACGKPAAAPEPTSPDSIPPSAPEAEADPPSEAATPTSEAPQSIGNKHFLLESAEGYELLPKAPVTIGFEGDGFSYNGRCNGHNGNYTLCAGHLCVDKLMSTKMACEQSLQAQDSWMSQFFSAKPKVELTDGKLTLSSDTATLVFSEQAPNAK